MNSGYVDICLKFQKVLFNPRAKKWMSYEWSEDDRDDEFWNKIGNFEQWLKEFFPKLKTRQLTRAEWRKIRRYANIRHRRLFSPRYLHEKQQEMHQLTSMAKINETQIDISSVRGLAPNTSSYEDVKATPDTILDGDVAYTSFQSDFDDSDKHLFRLLVETSNCLSRKAVVLDQIKQYMEPVQDGTTATQSMENENGGKLIMALYNLNTEILENFEKLWNFHQVKTTLLFSSKTRINANYFHQKCQLEIIQKFRQLQAHSLHEYQVFSPIVESLLTLAHMLRDCESHSREIFTEILTEEMKKLKILCGEEGSLFEQQWLPQLMQLFNKLTGTKEDEETNIMQYVS